MFGQVANKIFSICHQRRSQRFISAKRSILITALVFLFIANAVQAKISVFVSILPEKFFVEKVGGDQVNVFVMVQPGQSPETYEPQPRQISQLSQAKVYYRIGMPFEDSWMKRITATNQNIEIVDLRNGIALKRVNNHSDPHIWTDPQLVKIMANTIKNSLIKIDAKNASYYQNNYINFIHELDNLNQNIIKTLDKLTKREFIIYHPSLSYFAQAYGLHEIPIEMQGKEPGPKDLEELINLAKQKDIKVVFVEPQFSKAAPEAIVKAIGGKIVYIDPLNEDYINNLLHITDVLADAMR